MTRDEFREWCRSQQHGSHRLISLVNCSDRSAPVPREPGDETEFSAVGNLADRLEESMSQRRMQAYGANLRESARTR